MAAFAEKIDERSDRLLELLREAPRTVDELVAIRLLYPLDYDAPWVQDVERRTIAQHLDELKAAGRVVVDERTERGERYALA